MTASRLALAGALLALVATELPAQNSVVLRLRPRLGDTLHMRLDQQMEMRGRTRESPDSERVMTSSMRVRARAIPTRLEGGATIITTITDSLIVTSGPADLPQPETQRPAFGFRPVEVRVRADGAMEVLDPEQHEDAVSPLVGQMPAVLPGVAVSVGDQWVRQMQLPVRGSRGSAVVRATFRLDSLARGGQVAYISVRGTFQDTALHGDRPMDGTLTGSIEFDRDLGWIRDMRTTIATRTEVRPADRRTAPMAVWMRITQRLQARNVP